MREENTAEKRTTDLYNIISLTFLVIALIFLVAAAFVQGKEHIESKIVLIIFGACMLTAGTTISLLKRTSRKSV